MQVESCVVCSELYANSLTYVSHTFVSAWLCER